LKILIFTDRYNFNGGVEKTSKAISLLLKNNNYDVIYVSLGDFDLDSSECIVIKNSSYFLHKLLFRFVRNLNFEKKIQKILNEFSPDVIYIFNDNLNTNSIYSIFSKYKIIKAVNDYHVICPLSHAVQSNFANCYKLNSVNKSCNCLSNNSFFYKKFHLTFYYFKLYLYKKHVDFFTVSSPVLLENMDFNPFKNKSFFLPNPLTENYHVFNNNIQYDFCFIGHLDVSKGFNLILEFFKNNLEILNNVLIIGDGLLKSKLENIIITSPYGYKIHYIESVSNISYYIQKSKFVIVPSIMNDNEPGVLKIALLNNKFVFGSNRGGIPWILKEAGINSIFDPCDYSDFEVKLLKLLFSNLSFNNNYKIKNMFSDIKFLNDFKKIIKLCE
jgi:hypothetical protein